MNILHMIIFKEGLDGLFMRPLSIDHTALCSLTLAGLSEVSCPSSKSRKRTFFLTLVQTFALSAKAPFPVLSGFYP